MKLSALALLASAAFGAEPVKVALTIGGHAFDLSFFTIFEGVAEFKIDVQPHPASFSAGLKRQDVLVLYDMLDELPPAKRAALQSFAESGKGIVILHHALIDYTDWPWWHQNVSGGKYLRPADGPSRSTFQHDVDIPMRPVGDHPIVRGLKPFTLHDETYKGMWHSPDNQVLLETSHALSDRPLAWITPWRKSRVVAIQPGHGPEAHRDSNYRTLVRNAVLWAAGRL
ncbi:MAG: ThuA domain-containing protein [Acidobacteria bacterium]|nr:ThuA domain-containing protein [Acidobacteriota bacterium]